MSPASRFPRPTTSDITKTGVELPPEASEGLDKELEFERVESREGRTHRLSAGVLIAIMAVILFFLLSKTSGKAHFAFTDALAGKELGTLTVSGFPIVLVSAIACLLASAAFFMGRSRHTLTVTAGVVAGVAIIIGFQMLTAAFAAALVGSMTHSVFAAIVAAIIASVLTAALLAVFTIKYFVDQVVMGVVVNLFASGLTGFLYTQLLSPEAEKYNTAPIMEAVPIPVLSKIPFFGPIFFDQTILVYIGFLCIPLVWFLLWRTKWGLRVRSVGEHPEAADTVGISVASVRWSAVLVGGVFAGLGGAYFTIGTVGSFSKDITVGNGFIALAALIMGRWRPGLAAVMALFFSVVTQLSTELSTISAPMPSQFLLILPYIATIVAVAGLVGKVRSPAADGTPYIKE